MITFNLIFIPQIKQFVNMFTIHQNFYIEFHCLETSDIDECNWSKQYYFSITFKKIEYHN